MKNNEKMKQIRNGLIVSCQAQKGEPTYKDGVIACMALAAECGGAAGIRANGIKDIVEIRKVVSLPIIGLIKKNYDDSEVFITPTMDEINKLMDTGVDIIAMDATNRLRPGGISLGQLFDMIKKHYPDQLLMADCSTYEEGLCAAGIGFDIIGTTMSGYTKETKGVSLPDFHLMELLAKNCNVPVIAEGGIWTPEELKKTFDCGVYASVVGTAITRPHEITRRFVSVLK